MSPSVFLLSAIMALVVGLSGCESSTDANPPERSTPSSAPTHPDAGLPQMFERRDDLVDLRPVEWYDDDGGSEQWNDWELVDERTVRFFFLAGRAACNGAEATVVETDDSVHITLYVGRIPGAGTCTDDLLGATVDVHLDRPLGDRTLTYAD